MRFVGMGGLGDPGAMQRFVDAFELPFPNTVSVDGRLWARFGVAAQPAWVFVDRTGRAELYPYELSERQLRQILDAMLSAQA